MVRGQDPVRCPPLAPLAARHLRGPADTVHVCVLFFCLRLLPEDGAWWARIGEVIAH